MTFVLTQLKENSFFSLEVVVSWPPSLAGWTKNYYLKIVLNNKVCVCTKTTCSGFQVWYTHIAQKILIARMYTRYENYDILSYALKVRSVMTVHREKFFLWCVSTMFPQQKSSERSYLLNLAGNIFACKKNIMETFGKILRFKMFPQNFISRA